MTHAIILAAIVLCFSSWFIYSAYLWRRFERACGGHLSAMKVLRAAEERENSCVEYPEILS